MYVAWRTSAAIVVLPSTVLELIGLIRMILVAIGEGGPFAIVNS